MHRLYAIILIALLPLLTACQSGNVAAELDEGFYKGCPVRIDRLWPDDAGEDHAKAVPPCNVYPSGTKFIAPQLLAYTEKDVDKAFAYARANNQMIIMPGCSSEGCYWTVPAMKCADRAAYNASLRLEIDTPNAETYIPLENKVRAYNLQRLDQGLINPAWQCERTEAQEMINIVL